MESPDNVVIGTFTELGWNSMHTEHSIVQFDDKSILVIETTDCPNSVGDIIKHIRRGDAVKSYTSITEALRDIKTYGYEELGYIRNLKIGGKNE